MSDSVLGVLLHAFALACVAFFIWAGFAESKRADAAYVARNLGGSR